MADPDTKPVADHELPSMDEVVQKLHAILCKEGYVVAALALAGTWARTRGELERARDQARALLREWWRARFLDDQAAWNAWILEFAPRAAKACEGVGFEDLAEALTPVPVPPALPASNDVDAMTAAATRLADKLSREVEPSGWRYGLFLYRDAGTEPVIAISRDRDRTAMAVAHWLLDHLESKKKGSRPGGADA
jgi:hypothetical protein